MITKTKGVKIILVKKMGRPTDSPKVKQIGTRVDAETLQILEKYCEQESIPQNEGVRRGIKKLKADIKK